MESHRPTFRRRVLALIIIVLGVPILFAAILLVYFWRFSPFNREWVVDALQKRYQCEVELKSFSVSFFPMVSISGEGLVLKRQATSGLPPVASVREFSAAGSWLGLLRQPMHFGRVRLDGLVIVIPLGQGELRRRSNNRLPPPRFSSWIRSSRTMPC